jgi:hypothetical protein
MIQHETVGMPRSTALSDLPLVSREVKATFDVVGRATGKAMRITMHATVGIPYDEGGHVEDAGSFQVDDFDGRSRLDYLRLDGGLYALRHGLDRWQKPFVNLPRELDVLDGFTEDRRLMPFAPRHGVTGAKINSWTTTPAGRVGDPYLDTIYDMSAVPARMAELRDAIARNTVLTAKGLAYRTPYPSWVVSDRGEGVALTRPSRAEVYPVRAFGLDRLDDALDMARRMGGDPGIGGRVIAAPDRAEPDGSARRAAVYLADDIGIFLNQQLADLASEHVHLWHDCANAEAIVDALGTDGLTRVFRAVRTLALEHEECRAAKAFGRFDRWGIYEEARIGIELGEPAAVRPPEDVFSRPARP